MKLKEEKFGLISETERLIIRPLKYDDYENWLSEFEKRYPSQNRHDQGKIDMSECTREWFHKLVDKHQELLCQILHMYLVCLEKKMVHI